MGIKLENLYIPTMDDISFESKKVLVRVDFNSPLDPQTKDLLDESRIKAHVPTLRELLNKGSSVTVLSHQGRPGIEDFTSLEKHAKSLAKYLGEEVIYVDDIAGPYARDLISKLGDGEILLLDNVRLMAEENIESPPQKAASSIYVQRLYRFFDLYINDAFATAHRSQPSLVGFPMLLPSVAGRLMEKEVRVLTRIYNPEETPKVFVLGRGKVHDTIKIIENLVRRRMAERILTGGLVAELFLVAKGVDLGRENMSFLEEKGLLPLASRARRILMLGAPVEMPLDFKVLLPDGTLDEQPVYRVNGLIRDIGSETLHVYSELMKEAATIVLRGPMGVMEDPRFRDGTIGIVRAALESNAFIIVGGGHMSAIASNITGESHRVHLSTGGGALLIFLSGEELPALRALSLSAERFIKKS